MPLLRRQPFVKEPIPVDIDPDEEVFHCKPTGEIFREYERFFERVIVCNSLVWSCSVTGKPNLTYEEAVASEKKALKHVQNFPKGLRCPVLLLAMLTHRSRMVDMNDDVYSYIRNRFFVGEEVELIVGSEKKPCKVLKVVPTASSTISNGHASHASDSDDPDRKKDITTTFYKYTVEVTDRGKDVSQSEVKEVSPDQLSRPKRLVSRDRLKLFLKVHSEPVNGIWKVKDEYINEYHLCATKYSDFFPSPVPVFAVTNVKKVKRNPREEHVTPARKGNARSEEGRKSREYSRYSPSPVTPNRLKLTPEEKAFLKDKQRQEKMAEKRERKEKIAESRARMKEEKGKARKNLKEQKRLQAEVLKEWSKPRDDLDCDDLKPLPCPRPISTRLQNELFGDVIMILEFFECFGDVVGLHDRFPQGVTLDMMEKALLESDINGPLADLLAVFLAAIFSCQDQEDEDVLLEAAVAVDADSGAAMDDSEDIDNASGALSHKELMASAAAAAQVPQLCHGRSLKEFSLDAFTVTEVLRLHFAASGARCNAASAKFRYQQRGGFMSLDDGGMELRRQDADALLKLLSAGNVFDLTPEAKLKIIEALVTQLLSYSSYRDIIEDELESLKQARTELRQLQWAEQRREKEKASARYRKRREQKAKEGKISRRRGRKSASNSSGPGDDAENRQLGHPDGADARGAQTSVTTAAEAKDDAASKKEARRLANKLLKDSAKREAAAVAAQSSDGRTRRKATFEDSLDVSEFFEVDWDLVISSAANEEEKATLLVRREEVEAKRKEAFLEKEREMSERAQRLGYKCGTHPLGRDRCYRRYWLFHSVPGLYVEQCDDTVPPEFAAAMYEHAQRAGSAAAAAVPASDRRPDLTDTENRMKNSEDCNNDGVCETKKALPSDGSQQSLLSAGAGGDMKPVVPAQVKSEDGEGMSAFQTPHLVPVQESRWMYFNSEDDLDKVIEGLNERGFRESFLKQALIDARPLLQQSLQKAHADEAVASEKSGKAQPQSTSGRARKGRQVAGQGASVAANGGPIKGRGSLVLSGSVPQCAQDMLELSLREALLDLEERIYAGALGAIKVADRQAWRQLVERGTVPNGHSATTSLKDVHASAVDTAAETSAVDAQGPVKALAQALLDIQKGIDVKYLCAPLGDAARGKLSSSKAQAKQQRASGTVSAASAGNSSFAAAVAVSADDTPTTVTSEAGTMPVPAPMKASLTTLERWQDSLLASTSIPQVFLHMSTLEKAIQWSKSALNARCALCRRKGDGEKMLLCDGCDRGHHMYCLKPPVKEVPEGDWFCPECRPKETRPSRQRSKRTPASAVQDEENYTEAASAGTSSSSSSSAEDEEEEDEEEEEEEAEDDDGDDVEEGRRDVSGREEDEEEDEEEDDDEEEEEEDGEEEDDQSEDEEGVDNPVNKRGTPSASNRASPAGSASGANKGTAISRSKAQSKAKGEAGSIGSAVPRDSGRRASAKRSGAAAGLGDESESTPKAKKSSRASNSGSTPSTAPSTPAVAEAPGSSSVGRASGGSGGGDSSRRQRRPRAGEAAAASRVDSDSPVTTGKKALPTPKAESRSSRKSDGASASADTKASSSSGSSSSRRVAKGADTTPQQLLHVSLKTRQRGEDQSRDDGDAMQRCEQLLSLLMKHEDAWPFIRPVNRREVPDYYTIIKHPMDFSTIRSKINLISYTDVQEVIEDIRLVFQNCQIYNDEDSDVYKLGEKLSKFFESKLKSMHVEDAPPAKRLR